MPLREDLEQWQNSEFTQLYKADIGQAIEDLSYKLVYEESIENMRILQGMIRAYMDVLDVLEEGDFIPVTNKENEG